MTCCRGLHAWAQFSSISPFLRLQFHTFMVCKIPVFFRNKLSNNAELTSLVHHKIYPPKIIKCWTPTSFSHLIILSYFWLFKKENNRQFAYSKISKQKAHERPWRLLKTPLLFKASLVGGLSFNSVQPNTFLRELHFFE